MRREQPWVYEKTCHCSGVVVLMSQMYKSTAALHWEERRCVRSYHVNSKNVNDSLEIQGNIYFLRAAALDREEHRCVRSLHVNP